MKNYIIYLLSIFAMSLLLACDRGGEFELGNNTLALTLSCSDITRATDPDVDALNENKIVSLDCFFYAASPNATTADFDAPSLAHRRISSISATGQYTTYISFEDEDIARIFGNSNKCFIYVIANRPESVALPATPAGPTINQLKALVVESDFRTYTTPQSSFVMDSEGNDVVTLTVNDNNSKTLEGDVELRRAAAKISFTISKFGEKAGSDVVTINGKTYTPNYEGIYVIFNNCVYRSHIAPDVVSNDDINDRYCDVGDNNAKKIAMLSTKVTEDKFTTPCTLSMPFYSYPSDWSETEEKDAYISLVVPWKTVDDAGAEFIPYHYKVPINPDKDKLERNIHYKISVQISMLGTLDPDQAVVVEPSYVIFDCLNWNNDEINAIITDFRYLMVEENSYVLNNVDEIKIPYWTSHECEIVDIKITRPNLITGGTDNITSGYTLERNADHIYYKRELINDFTKNNFDFAPYTITFTIQHTTESDDYQEEITITQYPAVYGSQDINTDATNGGTDNQYQGFVWVNGYQGTSANNNQDYFSAATGLSNSTGVTSTTMLVFTVSSVEGTKYVIGDPREEVVNSDFMNEKHNSNRYSIWASAPGVEGGAARYLQNYYATYTNHSDYNRTTNSTANIYANETEAAVAERTYNMIAPKFRISSGYGAISSFTGGENQYYHYMKKRCASYQEDGYPAGRWRLPTKAEFEFIVDLSYKEKVPLLFNNTLRYWCAHGHGSANTSTGTVSMTHATYYNNSMISVRCVYDDWYWGSEPVIDNTVVSNNRFTWGDVNRANKADAPAIKY